MDTQNTLILGIETSCDETAAAVVRNGRDVLSSVVASQIDLHAAFGGVVPEVASRQHLLAILPVVERAIGEARVDWSDLSALAVTEGPGLAGSLLVGVNAAKSLSFAHGIPLVGLNHLEGHIYANWLDGYEPTFPLVCLIVSGAHSDLILMTEHLTYRRLGRTRDDAAGEAFDKVARILGLGYPGGPAIQKASALGDPRKLRLPRAWLGDSYDFSFSGLKTAVLRVVEARAAGDAYTDLANEDIAASFQEAVVDVLVEKTRRAAAEFAVGQVLLAGGVAANGLLRQWIVERVPLLVHFPPLKYCTDNAAMIAGAGHFRYLAGTRTGLDLDVHPNLALV